MIALDIRDTESNQSRLRKCRSDHCTAMLLGLISLDHEEERDFAQRRRVGQLGVFCSQLLVYGYFYFQQAMSDRRQQTLCSLSADVNSSACAWTNSIGFVSPLRTDASFGWAFWVAHGGMLLLLILAVQPSKFKLLNRHPMLVDGTNAILIFSSSILVQCTLGPRIAAMFAQGTLPRDVQQGIFVSTTFNRTIRLSGLIMSGCIRPAYSWPIMFVAMGLITWTEGVLEPAYLGWLQSLQIVTPLACWIASVFIEHAMRSAIRQGAVAATKAEELNEMKMQQMAAKAENEFLITLDREKDGLLSVISHEMKTPLNGLLGMLQLAKLRCNGNPIGTAPDDVNTVSR